jgi:hypothetical protein
MGDFPADPSLFLLAVAMDPMADTLNPGELLGVQMDQIPRSLVLVAVGGLSFE